MYYPSGRVKFPRAHRGKIPGRKYPWGMSYIRQLRIHSLVKCDVDGVFNSTILLRLVHKWVWSSCTSKACCKFGEYFNVSTIGHSGTYTDHTHTHTIYSHACWNLSYCSLLHVKYLMALRRCKHWRIDNWSCVCQASWQGQLSLHQSGQSGGTGPAAGTQGRSRHSSTGPVYWVD